MSSLPQDAVPAARCGFLTGWGIFGMQKREQELEFSAGRGCRSSGRAELSGSCWEDDVLGWQTLGDLALCRA